MGADPNQRGDSRRWIVRSVENSLRRLGTDHLDLYQLHRPDHDTDTAETLSALSDLVQAGKIRAFGSSMFPAEDDRRGAVDRGASRYAPVPDRADHVLVARPRHQCSVLPTVNARGWG